VADEAKHSSENSTSSSTTKSRRCGSRSADGKSMWWLVLAAFVTVGDCSMTELPLRD
jgi:hypothetical protein